MCLGSSVKFGGGIRPATGLAAFHDSRAQPVGEFLREFIGFLAAVHVDSLAGGVDDYLAVVAGAEVLLDLGEKVGVDLTIEVVG